MGNPPGQLLPFSFNAKNADELDTCIDTLHNNKYLTDFHVEALNWHAWLHHNFIIVPRSRLSFKRWIFGRHDCITKQYFRYFLMFTQF